ncbi:MAG: DAK2 domain-containing protein, partial [Spirochaetota bacterium]
EGTPPPPGGSPARGGGAPSGDGDGSAPTPGELAALLRAGLEGVVQRGRALPGDKTMVDALHPAAAALERAAGEGEPLARALSAAEEAARRGMEQTVPMTARKGRASYLGERSVGHQDPGATSAWLLVKALARAAAGEEDR